MQAPISQMRFLLLALLAGSLAAAAQEITVLERQSLALPGGSLPGPTLTLTLAYLEGSGWSAPPIEAAVRETGKILAQCGVVLARVELLRIGAPARFRDFHVPVARELARTLPLPRPAVYFVADTRQRPAFDAEAIGWSNSRTRPELADTVWITRATRDLGIALAHELAHVLMDSGEHSIDPGNLMNAETAPQNMRLSPDQCARLNHNATANGLLRPPAR